MSRVATIKSADPTVHAAGMAKDFEKAWYVLGHDAWRLFLDDCCCSLIPGYKLSREISEKEREVLFDLGQHYARAVSQCPPFSDILGPLYMEIGSKGSRDAMGQFFTPGHICDLMAAMSMPGIEDRLRTDSEPVQIMEPAVGAGGTLLAALRLIYNLNPEYMRRVSVHAVDIDFQCVQMAAIQVLAPMLIHRDAALHSFSVWHGNTLEGEDRLKRFISTQINDGSSPGTAASDEEAKADRHCGSGIRMSSSR